MYDPWWSYGTVTAVGAAAIVAGIFVFAVAPSRRLNQVLALFLLVEGVNTGADSTTGYATLPGALQVVWVTGFALPGLYLLFLSWALDIPLTRPLRRRASRVAIGVAMVAWTGFGIATMADPFESVTPVLWLRVAALIVSSTFGLVAAIQAVRRTRAGTLGRRQAKSYAVAFAARDIGWLVLAPFAIVLNDSAYQTASWHWVMVGWTASGVLFVGALTLGLMRGQIVGIDLKLKRTVQAGTLAGTFVLVLVVVAQLAQNLLSTRYGWWLGGLAAGLLLFALAPLQRLAEKVAHQAVPHADDSADYLAFRRMEVYREAVEGLMADGSLSEKEAVTLRRLQRKLGIADASARKLEKDVRSARPS